MSWTRDMAAAFAAMAEGHFAEAAEQWLQVANDTQHAEASEPLRAAAQNNAGVAHILLCDLRAARIGFEKAATSWARTRRALDAAEVAMPGRSSVFHLRLAMRHTKSFEALGRRRYELLCATAAAITRHNKDIAAGKPLDIGANDDLLTGCLETFGPGSPEAAILRDARVTSVGVIALATMYAGFRTRAAQLLEACDVNHPQNRNFLVDLEHAVSLTAIVHPGLQLAAICARKQA